MRFPRIVLVTRQFWPIIGGSEKTIANLAGELARRGCGVTILTTKWSKRWPSKIGYRDVPVVRLTPAPRDTWTTIRYVGALGRWLRRRQDEYELVYVSGLKHEAYAAVKAVGQKRPVVLRAERAGRWGDCLWQIEALLGRRIKRRLMRADAFVARTPAVRHELVAAGYPRDRIHYLPDGVPIPPRRNRESQTAARELLFTANPAMRSLNEAPVAVYAGRLSQSHGVGDLLDAWIPIVGRWPRARLWLVGDGPFQRALAERIAARSLSGRVTLAGVFDKMEELFTAADLCVVPSREGSASLALLEAMAAGLPIVATDLPDHRGFAVHGQHALLVPPRNVSAMSEAIATLLSEKDRGSQMGEAARRQAVEQFSLARMTQEHLQLWEKLLAPLSSPEQP